MWRLSARAADDRQGSQGVGSAPYSQVTASPTVDVWFSVGSIPSELRGAGTTAPGHHV